MCTFARKFFMQRKFFWTSVPAVLILQVPSESQCLTVGHAAAVKQLQKQLDDVLASSQKK